MYVRPPAFSVADLPTKFSTVTVQHVRCIRLLGQRFKAEVQRFLLTDTVKAVLNETQTALSAITVLKKICDHPALLSDKLARQALANSGGRRTASCSSSDSSDFDDDSLEDFIVHDSDADASSSGSSGESDYDEAEELQARTQRAKDAARGRIEGLDPELLSLTDDDVLHRLEQKAVDDSCKTVRPHVCTHAFKTSQ